MGQESATPVLRVRGLRVGYRRAAGRPYAVDGVDLDVDRGEIVALVGESGSGKTTAALAVTRLLPAAARVSAGEILFKGRDLASLDDAALCAVRGRAIGFIPQDPAVALNPVHRIGDQVAEVLRIHGLARGEEARQAALDALSRAGVPEPGLRAGQYPHQLSGGTLQRVLIAIALAGAPELIIAD
jgi:peptide/nickel transport system ATP-binding protein